MKIDTNSLLKSIRELLSENTKEYVEECVKGMLKLRYIDIEQYSYAMEVIYGNDN